MDVMLEVLEKRRDDLLKGLERLRADMYATDGALQEVEKTITDLKTVMADVVEKAMADNTLQDLKIKK